MSVNRLTASLSDHFWSLSGDGESVSAALRQGDDPGVGPTGPWTAAVRRPDGTVAAAASTDSGGLFWALSETPGAPPVFAPSVVEVIEARTARTHIDEDYLRGYLLLDAPPTRTPYREIGRIPGGWTMIFPADGGAPVRAAQWCGPAVWSTPTRLGADVREEYLDTFDAAVDSLASGAGPLVATMSGGLDSTFVVGSLLRHASPDRPVEALCHSPHAGAGLEPRGNWDPDDFPVARAMVEAHPGLIRLHRVLPEDTDRPLDAALRGAETSWLPVFNPGNQIWLRRMSEMAGEMGSDRLFVGANGNASFSFDHTPRPLHRRWGGAVRSRLRRGPDPYLKALGLRLPHKPRLDRAATFLSMLEPGGALSAVRQRGTWPAPMVDPFASRSVVDLAASIAPTEWNAHGMPRGFARAMGRGRVPDEIRLRTRRGGQAWDTWYLIRDDRDRYLAEIDLLANTAVLGGWVDDAAVRRRVGAWPWGEVAGPPMRDVIAIDRLLSLAAFIRLTGSRLRRIDLR